MPNKVYLLGNSNKRNGGGFPAKRYINDTLVYNTTKTSAAVGDFINPPYYNGWAGVRMGYNFGLTSYTIRKIEVLINRYKTSLNEPTINLRFERVASDGAGSSFIAGTGTLVANFSIDFPNNANVIKYYMGEIASPLSINIPGGQCLFCYLQASSFIAPDYFSGICVYISTIHFPEPPPIPK